MWQQDEKRDGERESRCVLLNVVAQLSTKKQLKAHTKRHPKTHAHARSEEGGCTHASSTVHGGGTRYVPEGEGKSRKVQDGGTDYRFSGWRPMGFGSLWRKEQDSGQSPSHQLSLSSGRAWEGV